MGGNRARRVPQQNTQQIYPISPKDAAMARVPWFVEFEPAVQILPLASAQVDYTQGWMDFVCLQIGFTSETIGSPATPGRFKVQIQDIQASKSFQPAAWDITPLIGGNFGISDSSPADMPVPWPFMEKSTIRVIFTNRQGIACMPTLLMIGYLTVWERDATAAAAHQELELNYKKALIRQLETAQTDDKW